jgi:hypothetical protein
MQAIEAAMAAQGRTADGPDEYALGRGHLALEEPEQARICSARGRCRT